MPRTSRLIHLLVFVPVVLVESGPRWREAIRAGSGCFPPRCDPGQLPLALPILVHGDRLVMIGDGADPRHIHESRDGRTWVAQEHDATWGNVYGAAHASYRGALWRMGGFVAANGERLLQNDVWRSRDGRRWERLATRAPWPPRARAHLIAFRDTLWLIGGEPNDGMLWFTVDGVTWSARNAAGLPRRNPQGVVVFRGSLWILGHGTWEDASNDVWSSPDATTWTLVVGRAGWSSRTGAGFGVLRNALWVVGGAGHRDVWSSDDGAHWREASERLPGPPRSADYSIVFREGLWVFGGKTGGAGGTGFWDGVWYLE